MWKVTNPEHVTLSQILDKWDEVRGTKTEKNRVQRALEMTFEIDWQDDTLGVCGTIGVPRPQHFSLVGAMNWVTANRAEMKKTYPDVRFHYVPLPRKKGKV